MRRVIFSRVRTEPTIASYDFHPSARIRRRARDGFFKGRVFCAFEIVASNARLKFTQRDSIVWMIGGVPTPALTLEEDARRFYRESGSLEIYPTFNGELGWLWLRLFFEKAPTLETSLTLNLFYEKSQRSGLA